MVIGRLTAYAEVATVLDSIPASSDTVEKNMSKLQRMMFKYFVIMNLINKKRADL